MGAGATSPNTVQYAGMKERTAAAAQASAIAKTHHDEYGDIKDYRENGAWLAKAYEWSQLTEKFNKPQQAKLTVAATSAGMSSGQCDQLIAAVKVQRKEEGKKRGRKNQNAKRAAKRKEAGGKERQPKKAKPDEAGLNSSA